MGTNFNWKRAEDGRRLVDGQAVLTPNLYFDGSPLHNIGDLGTVHAEGRWDEYLIAYRAAQLVAPLEIADDMHPFYHIGKRSGAGAYCWDCNTTLCADGPEAIHMGLVPDHYNPADLVMVMRLRMTNEDKTLWRNVRWYDECPNCGLKRDSDGHNSAFMELGFQPAANDRPKGVSSCSSFSWAQEYRSVLSLAKDRMDETLITDEYGRDMTCNEFLRMIDVNCPLKFDHSIGQEFS